MLPSLAITAPSNWRRFEMKKPPLGGSGQEAKSDLNLPATNRQRLLDQQILRPHLIPVGTQKRPLTSGWQEPDRHYSDQELVKAPAIGLRLGYPVLAIDFDPKPDSLSQAERTFEQRTGRSSAELPISWTVTSGKPGRRQVLLQVDPSAAPWLKPWSQDALEFRWRGQSSVIDGHHPEIINPGLDVLISPLHQLRPPDRTSDHS